MAKNEFLKQQALIANGGKIKVRRPRKWLYPMAAERSYQRELRSINNIQWQIIIDNTIPSIPFLVEQAQSIRPDGDGLRLDNSWVNQLRELTDKSYHDFEKAVGKPKIDSITADQAQKISAMNKEQFVKVIHSAIKVNPITAETWLQPKMQAFQAQNTDLITNLSIDQSNRVQQTLYRNLSAGNGIDEIKKQLIEDKEFGKNRSNLIARDQTNKFNSQLAQLRQQEVGIGSYIWTTARDERVRSSHSNLDGKEISWNKPPAIGHAGEPIQCRCIPQPVITDEMFDGEVVESSATPIDNNQSKPATTVDEFKIKSKFNKIKYSKDLTATEIDSVMEYQGAKFKNSSGGYTNIQSYLRSGKANLKNIDSSDIKKVVSNLDKSISKGAFIKDETVYRGVKFGKGYVDMDIGSTFTEKGYFSSAKNIGTAKKFAPLENRNQFPVVFNVAVKKGQNAIFVTDFAKGFKEGEVLLPRNSKFKVIKKRRIDDFDRWEIDVELIK